MLIAGMLQKNQQTTRTQLLMKRRVHLLLSTTQVPINGLSPKL